VERTDCLKGPPNKKQSGKEGGGKGKETWVRLREGSHSQERKGKGGNETKIDKQRYGGGKKGGASKRERGPECKKSSEGKATEGRPVVSGSKGDQFEKAATRTLNADASSKGEGFRQKKWKPNKQRAHTRQSDRGVAGLMVFAKVGIVQGWLLGPGKKAAAHCTWAKSRTETTYGGKRKTLQPKTGGKRRGTIRRGPTGPQIENVRPGQNIITV